MRKTTKVDEGWGDVICLTGVMICEWIRCGIQHHVNLFPVTEIHRNI
jgi:hypothetical protein